MNEPIDTAPYVVVQQRSPHRSGGVCPGDAVTLACDYSEVVPLVSHPRSETDRGALERDPDSITGSGTITGWISKGDIALVIAVVGDGAFVLGSAGNDWGWVMCDLLINLVEFSRR